MAREYTASMNNVTVTSTNTPTLWSKRSAMLAGITLRYERDSSTGRTDGSRCSAMARA